MYKLEQFFSMSFGEVCIHCETEDQANILLKAFHEMGKSWCTGQSYLKINHFSEYHNQMVYYNDGAFCNVMYAKRNDHIIIEFKDILLPSSGEKLKQFIRSIK